MDQTTGYKRITAAVLLAFWAGLTVYGVYDPSSPSGAAGEFASAPIFLFAAGAFGLDAVMKKF